MIHSLAGHLPDDGLVKTRPYRDPHHSASLPALIGGGQRAKPGEVSLAHKGVLFLDELPEFQRATLESLRQPIESGEVLVSRVNYHAKYPANVQLVAAMNPCRCGHLGTADMECTKAPRCGADYQAKISGPMFDRIDISVDVPQVSIADLQIRGEGEKSEEVAKRVVRARNVQEERALQLGLSAKVNSETQGEELEKIAPLESDARDLLLQAADKMKLSARAYHRVIRLARTIADMEQKTIPESLSKAHIAEALSYRRASLRE